MVRMGHTDNFKPIDAVDYGLRSAQRLVNKTMVYFAFKKEYIECVR